MLSQFADLVADFVWRSHLFLVGVIFRQTKCFYNCLHIKTVFLVQGILTELSGVNHVTGQQICLNKMRRISSINIFEIQISYFSSVNVTEGELSTDLWFLTCLMVIR